MLLEKMDSGLKENTQLLQQFAKGDEQAFKVLYFRFYNRLLLYGSTITDQWDTVEDQVQELFTWVYMHPQACQSIRNIESYLYLALKKNIRSALQKETRQQTQQDQYSDCLEQSISGIEDQLIQTHTEEQHQRWLTEQMDQLPARMQEVIYLRYYRCLGYEEIASIMSVTPQVARNFAARALKKMRQSLPQLQRLLSLIVTLLVAG